jgi:[acyl-carrier-protein] S-malonyltransferase
VSQPAIYVASLAALEKLKEERPEVVESCDVAAGLSLGEYTALAFAGAMTFEDGLKLVHALRMMHVLAAYDRSCNTATHQSVSGNTDRSL